LQHFVLTNCSDTSRLVVSKLMFTRPDTIPAKIEPLSWCFAVVFLFGSILYFLYFIFMWGVQNHGLTLQNWCINAAISFGQVYTHSPTYSLTHSLTYSPTYLLTYLLTHLLTHSLTCALIGCVYQRAHHDYLHFHNFIRQKQERNARNLPRTQCGASQVLNYVGRSK